MCIEFVMEFMGFEIIIVYNIVKVINIRMYIKLLFKWKVKKFFYLYIIDLYLTCSLFIKICN